MPLTDRARRLFAQALADAGAADRICDIIDADSGTVSDRDMEIVRIALADRVAADEITAGVLGATLSDRTTKILANAMCSRQYAAEIVAAIAANV